MSHTAHKDVEQMNILKLLADKLGTKESEAEVAIAIETLLGRLSSAEKAQKTLETLATAMGLEDASSAVASVTSLISKAAELEKALPELESLRKMAAKLEEEEEEEEVEEAMASRNLDDAGVKLAMLTLRRSDKEGFRKQFPKVDPPAAAPAPIKNVPAHLTRSVAVARGAEVAADGSVRIPQGRSDASESDKVKIDLTGVAGANRTLKLMAWLKGRPGNEKLSHEDVTKQAWTLAKTAEIVGA
jgi:hypothetical protein